MNEPEPRTVQLLLALYQSCLEGENSYRVAFEEASDSDLKYLFSSYSLQRAKFARQLREAIVATGQPPPAIAEEIKATPERFSDRSSRAILDDCARGEEIAIARYKEALAADPAGPVRELLDRQLKEVETVLNRIRQLHGLAQPT